VAAIREDILPDLTRAILGSAITVHRDLGPGLLEGTYRACLMRQLATDGLAAAHEVSIPMRYQGTPIDQAYRADIIVEKQVLLELKAVEALLPIHQAQVLSYLKHSRLRVGLLINFNVPRLVQGVRRFVR
jgi:GxxExxY protein